MLATATLTLAASGESGEPANPIRMFLNRDEIADYLGLTSSTVSRTFTQLARHCLIRLHRGRQVVLLRRDLLERLAEGTISLDKASGHEKARRKRRLPPGRES